MWKEGEDADEEMGIEFSDFWIDEGSVRPERVKV